VRAIDSHPTELTVFDSPRSLDPERGLAVPEAREFPATSDIAFGLALQERLDRVQTFCQSFHGCCETQTDVTRGSKRIAADNRDMSAFQ
jgi:hypothetical protein